MRFLRQKSRAFVFLPHKVSYRRKLKFDPLVTILSKARGPAWPLEVYRGLSRSSVIILYARVEISYTPFSLKFYVEVKE